MNLKTLTLDLSSVHDFVERNGKVAPKEISFIFNVSLQEAENFLKDLTSKRILQEEKGGNGFLYSLSNQGYSCDSRSGSCG